MSSKKAGLSWLIYFSFLIMSAYSCSPVADQFPEGAITGFDELIKEFKEPSKEYRTIPFFVWNSKITRQNIDDFMIEFKDAGCGGVFIHARPGLITPYLSEEWFELIKYTVKQGKDLGIDVWIYDEYNFPSGFAGGHVPDQMPESFNQGQGIQMQKYDQLPDLLDDYYLILKEENNQYSEVVDPEKEVGIKGKYLVFSKAYYFRGENDHYFHGHYYGGFTYVDVLYPGVTEKFIQVTMDGYEQYIGDEFGKTMPGIFTDEPHLNSPGGIRWTPDLFLEFKKRWGYDLKLNIPSLFEEVGDWKKVRHNYAQTLLQLFIDRWAKPYYQYCENKGLLLTGHYWEHTWPFIRLGPDNMAMYPWFQIPGIDMLFNQFNETSTNAQFGNVRSVKELSSVANQFGRHRTLCETYGGGGWDVSFADLKRLGDWEYALGVNLMNQHMSPITIVGSRKYDHPPYFTYHEPWWRDYKQLNDYFARLSVSLSSGKQDNDILVIEPTTTTWMYDSYDQPNEKISEIGSSFQAFVTNLEKAQVEYDLGSEEIIRGHGEIDNGKFIIGQCSYSRVVIPPLTENLDKSTFELIKKYVEQGGILIAYTVPSMMHGSGNQQWSDLMESNSENVFIQQDLSPDDIAEYFYNIDLDFLSVSGGNLFHHRRGMEDGQLLFLANSSLEENTEGALSVSGHDVVKMDPFTGEISDYAEEKDGDKINLTFSLPPAGSLLLFVSRTKTHEVPCEIVPEALYPIQSVSSMNVSRQRDNVMMIDFCDLHLGDQVFEEIHVLDAASRVYKNYEFEEGSPWFVHFENKLVERDTFHVNTGFTTMYRFQVDDTFSFSGISAVIEHPEVWTVSINGNVITNIPGKWWLDRSFGVYDIGEWIRPGENQLTVVASPMSIAAEITPVYILGNFYVSPAEKGWMIEAPPGAYEAGSWNKQGMPFYPWGVHYSKTFEIHEIEGYFELELGKWAGTVSEITINGTAAGIIAFPPYKLDVSDFIQKGLNTIQVTVIGSLKNLLGPVHNNPPAGMAISPFWYGVYDYPPGNDYQIYEYGLLDDFYLYQGDN